MVKINRSSILVLSLLALKDSLTRKVMATNVQKNLFKLGIKWAEFKGEQFQPEHLDADYLIVTQGKLLYDKGSPLECFGHILADIIETGDTSKCPYLYEIENNYEKFLKDAGSTLTSEATSPNTVEKNIHGVNVKVTKDGVELNATDLLKEITGIAEKIRQRQFGATSSSPTAKQE